ncbi:putative tautomerase [Candidatus Phycosocius bacilliformis]|uniref:Tautomerase n=1 Tax=Candidatus Phycosocius bacilliformis TaxID=1445552 RepID=A0A2P2ECP9_9PROT|nr:4-oxalocrotonate tautomerase family protein [Candidatus Phycosocius bacilliformis]GBF58821.1 putative tautomerase [Candidatus Phycosocius bacilliformis]
MPLVQISLTPDGLTTQKKETLIRKVTDLLVEELGKNPDTTVVIITEVETDNWGIGGQSVSQRRAR